MRPGNSNTCLHHSSDTCLLSLHQKNSSTCPHHTDRTCPPCQHRSSLNTCPPGNPDTQRLIEPPPTSSTCLACSHRTRPNVLRLALRSTYPLCNSRIHLQTSPQYLPGTCPRRKAGSPSLGRCPAQKSTCPLHNWCTCCRKRPHWLWSICQPRILRTLHLTLPPVRPSICQEDNRHTRRLT